MQALKNFTGGNPQAAQSQSGSSQNDFMGMAMGEAAKLFDQQSAQGNTGGASKNDVVQQAGAMALKMYMKSQGGGAGGLMSIASKFM
ncbi:hypothetical protein BT63DRAFT_419621 [Microthyrium microscopicum]|uniref:Beta-flanking protein n=1 Tax=Microthyrium microscopicum TaxID=703497 RepID=A0A6A6UPV5_9PEZI|nr:hypothetical protein BT63DRAFT_419621 [Microthyrium microscopicum]